MIVVTRRSLSIAKTLLAAALITLPAFAVAQPRHHGGGYNGPPRGYYRGGSNNGAVIGGALLGLGVGALIGGALAQGNYAPPPPVYYAPPPPPAYYAAPPGVYYPNY